MDDKETPRSGKRFLARRGVGLAISGALIAALFGIFMSIDQMTGEGWKSPMLVGVLLGLIMLVFGIYRLVKGNSSLDYPQGGTNNEPET
ncbi:hypothetical protein [Paeniglutamicibacter terrestris]|jgi:F0F1-type ATP synthase assembly protein I|uniref:Uncharacterized protein n=1 Tax=Paeniglutamicibacter terrestris TaxID=2723403 RepID=A0ABX1G7V2_9MICC|nr:hypothetical protein [Paeniglutamicibacter terrestris]ASN39408.1 hypothetical protein CGQ24_10545 [Arthrobacter sp. 7749]NKG21766.1 hypothetical protein [Paeniglutamicibacter terrestris]